MITFHLLIICLLYVDWLSYYKFIICFCNLGYNVFKLLFLSLVCCVVSILNLYPFSRLPCLSLMCCYYLSLYSFPKQNAFATLPMCSSYFNCFPFSWSLPVRSGTAGWRWPPTSGPCVPEGSQDATVLLGSSECSPALPRHPLGPQHPTHCIGLDGVMLQYRYTSELWFTTAPLENLNCTKQTWDLFH